MKTLLAFCLILGSAFGCQDPATKPTSASSEISTAVLTPPGPISVVATMKPAPIVSAPQVVLASMDEWRHGLAKSKFNPGNVTKVVDDAVHRAHVTIGDQGTYSESVNGWAQGSSEPTAKVFTKGPMSDFAKHRALALAYFRASGLSLDQVNLDQAYEATTVGMSDAPGSQTLMQTYTHVPRFLDGDKLVSESIAWVSFNADGEVISESVYWPAIGAAVVADARSLQKLHADPKQHAAFMAKVATALMTSNIKIDPSAVTGNVIIHHTDAMTDDASATAFASYDVRAGQTVRHFLVDGSEQK